ncbi:MAG: hypothetical protein C5B51_09630, partial [Terriglobia bacterium]
MVVADARLDGSDAALHSVREIAMLMAGSRFPGEEMPMETRRVLLITGGALAAFLFQIGSARLHAESQMPVALSGQATSAEEGPMEGVVVSAKKDGSTISVSVVTNAGGRFAFPAARLEPGHYTLKARAAG